MSKSTITVDSWVKEEDLILVYALKGDVEKDYKVSVAEFEAFIDRHDKREYCYDSCDYQGEHVQDAGVMPWYAYYESGCVERDLIEFIMIQEASQVFDDISNSIGKIIELTTYPKTRASNF